MMERSPYIPAHERAGSISASCIQHATVESSNLEQSQQWYKKVFNAEWSEENPRYMKLGSSELHLNVNDHPEPHLLNHFAIELEDWDAWLANLASVGVPFDRDPLQENGKLNAFLRDPDGNRIEVMYHSAWHAHY